MDMNNTRRPELQQFSAAIMNAQAELFRAQAALRQFPRNHPSFAAANLRVSTATRKLQEVRAAAVKAKSDFMKSAR